MTDEIVLPVGITTLLLSHLADAARKYSSRADADTAEYSKYQYGIDLHDSRLPRYTAADYHGQTTTF